MKTMSGRAGRSQPTGWRTINLWIRVFRRHRFQPRPLRRRLVRVG
jgi:hypothetical protein